MSRDISKVLGWTGAGLAALTLATAPLVLGQDAEAPADVVQEAEASEDNGPAAEGGLTAVSSPDEGGVQLAMRGSASQQEDNPFRSITARNAFRLKDPLPPPPPPTNPPPAPEQPKLDVKLAGLGEIGGVRYAYLVVPDTDQPGKFLYPALTDDPSHGRVRHGSGLEVRAIDLRQQTVRLVNGGIEASLNLKEHGVKAAPAPAAVPARPGSANRPGGVPPPPNAAAQNAALGTANAAGAEPIIFSRNPNRASGGNPLAGNAGLSAGGNPAGGAAATAIIPARPLRTDVVTVTGGASQGGNAPETPAIPRPQQYEVLIRQQQAAESLGIRFPPVPGMSPPGGEAAPVPQE